jgi:hypothetical protein
MDATLALWLSLGLITLLCWFVCAKIEPAVRHALKTFVSNLKLRPKTIAAPTLPAPLPGLRLPVPMPVHAQVTPVSR